MVLFVLTFGRLRDVGLSAWLAALPAGVLAAPYVMLTLEFKDAKWWNLQSRGNERWLT